MGPLNLVLWAAGVLLIGLGYLRAKDPWQRYQALKEQDANIARYEAWRGGARDTSRSGASVAMDLLRKQARVGAAIAGVGFLLVLAGFMIR
ncbi:MAG TPA: hypothetical protein VM344_11395 [Vitreimonas sp.]|nr:hypothetical protein [Vitreimonas sp.]